MFGTGLQFSQPGKIRRSHSNQQNDQRRVAPADFPVAAKQKVDREPDNWTASEESRKPAPVPAFEPVDSPFSNLERFLESITPSVPAQYLSKVW